jgi:aspartyl-tRNA(Asn)/glutamyl-tRNA(Gln) amidotransferase subunit A
MTRWEQRDTASKSTLLCISAFVHGQKTVASVVGDRLKLSEQAEPTPQQGTLPTVITAVSSCEGKGVARANAGIDGGGSVRVPSALCGIVGLRPTVGRTSTEHCPENAFSIMSFGSHTATVADAMLVYAVIANAGEL